MNFSAKPQNQKHMSNDTTTGAEATAAQNTTEQDEWAKLAESLPNRDGHVQTTDPLFDTGQNFLPCTVLKPERTAARDDKGVAVRLAIRFDAESVDSLGNKRAPGYVFRPRPIVIEGASDSPEDLGAAERGRRDLARMLENLSVLPKLGAHSKATLVASVGKLAEKPAKIKLTVKEGKRRDEETGELAKFQNFVLAAPGEGNGAGTAQRASATAGLANV